MLQSADTTTELSMAPIGKVRNITKKVEFEWRIEDFFTRPAEEGTFYKSPLFSYADESWYLYIYPNGQSKDNTVGYVALYLARNRAGLPICLRVSLGLRACDGKKDLELQFTNTLKKIGGYGSPALLTRDALLKKKMELVPSDTLTAFCTIEDFSKTIVDPGKETVECSQCKASFVPAHEQKCSDKAITCPTCAGVSVLKKCSGHECEQIRLKATKKLFVDLGNLLCDEEHSDVTLKVKDEEFRLHRCILACRNPYFNSMFKTEMKEKTTGIVTINDCEPHIFRSFINFVYTGIANDLSLKNVCDLYKVADKYQEDQLKEECLSFMNNEMSVETFCDFTVLSLKYNEKELLQNATDLFCREIKEIIQSVAWQTFVREYPIQANELHIKAVDYYVK